MDIDSRRSTDEHEHAVTIWEINRDRLTAMQNKLSDTPKLLSVTAGLTTCSIFKVPQSFVDINGSKAYQPRIVSMGPFHHGQPHLRMIEEHKWWFLRRLLSRTQAKGLVLEDYLRAVQPLEAAARECYSETIVPYGTDELIEMMVVDGCFVIELFRKICMVVESDPHDPLITMSWIFPFLLRDLICLENQLPFFILECLFELTKTQESPTLTALALDYFNYAVQRPKHVVEKYSTINAKHLLDLLRSTFIPSELEQLSEPDNHQPPNVIHNISKLRQVGIKIKPCEAESFLLVNFNIDVIHMPTISIDDFMCVFLLNSVAFEQCHSGCSKFFTAYVTLLDCLINKSGEEVGYLSDLNIIENYFGTDAEVATFFNNMGKDTSFDISLCYLAQLFGNVRRYYYYNTLHVEWSSFKYTYLKYFKAPWSFISASAATVLLILTFLQTVYTILSYVRPR